MSLPPSPRIHFRAGDLLPDLVARADREPEDGQVSERTVAQAADRDLHRYYYHLLSVLARLTFSQAEASFIVDALNGLLTEPHTADLVWANLDDAAREGLGEKWGIDGVALAARVRALGPFGQLAIADAAERYWQGPSQVGDRSAALRSVGLVR